MKTFKIIFPLLFPLALSTQTDFRFDSVLYPTMYAKDLCAFLKANPKTLLIDVRSPGEFADTSRYKNLNIGHLKNAWNISIDSIPKMLPELKSHVNDPIILYCSHSQRSRRVSKTLKENGFTQVRNLNGGLSWLNQAEEKDFPCKKEMIVSSLPYKTLPAKEAYEFIKADKNIFIVDVRRNSEFEGTDTVELLNMGRIKGAVNISVDDIKNTMAPFEKHRNGRILLYDFGGEESNRAAEILIQQGFKNVYTILGGLSEMIGKDHETMQMRKELLVNVPAYSILNAKETLDLLSDPAIVILDIRPMDEYNNQAKQFWRNLGRVKKAIHIQPSEFEVKIPGLLKYKHAAILVYGNRQAYKCCKHLKEAGFENVNIVYGGLWELVSTSANIYGFKSLRSYFENNEGLY